ncbi:MAG TPA: ABC transporter permease [Vicinamibacterales bacterium]|nr:ABC transporter permease [Vicinamibacterales bacterium]
MHALLSDLRYAVRNLRKSPTFTFVVVLTLALGIGANAVVFAVVKSVVLNPLPYGDPDRLVTLVETDSNTPNPETVSYATAQDWKRRTQVFDRLSLFNDFGLRPMRNGRAEELRGLRVSADFFETLGVPMLQGRSFRAEEDTPGGRHVLILTYGTWIETFGGDPGIVGRGVVTSDDQSYTVVGVLPPGFQPIHMSNPAELPRVFAPMGFDERQQTGRSGSWRHLRAIGKLKPGVTSRQAEAELNSVMRMLVGEYPEYRSDASVMVTPLRQQLVGRFESTVWMLQVSVLVLLVLACANVAALMLARTVGRQTDLAIRAALGASRAVLMRHLLAESVLLSVAAAIGGVSVAWVAIEIIAKTGDTNIPRIGELAPDASMLLFGIAASVVTALLFGLAPAAIASRSLFATLRAGLSVMGRRSHATALRGLIAAELALAFALVLVVGLLAKSYLRLMDVNPGYDAGHVLTLSLLPDGVRYGTPARRLGYFDAVVDEMRTIPGVQDAAYASTLPLSHPSVGAVYIREHPLASASGAPNLDTYLVSTNYLEVMKIAVVRGRGFTKNDTQSTAPVAVISESTARTQFPAEDPIGRHIQIELREDVGPWFEIVGVVGDVHQYGLDRKPDASVYVPLAQVGQPSQGWSSLVVRSTLPSDRIESGVRAAMAAVDPLEPIFHLQPMTTYISLSVSQRTFALIFVTAFGVLGRVLAMGGVYGVVSCWVEERRREVGLRLALGATRQSVCWMILRQLLLIILVGVSCGYVVAAMFTNSLSALLFGVTRFDLETTCGVALALAIAAVLAAAAPVARAAGVDPMAALRAD